MRAILKPFFALCGLVALSTALSADSRLFPAGGGGAGWGEPGFLYSDYLQTAAASGREVEFQGSFVLDNRRPFLAELGTAFPGRVVDEVKSLPLREWGLGYVFEKRRPAHQRALLERGWRLADWLAEETLMAATESSRGGGLIRTLEFDLQSELGGRRAQIGLNVLGALRESNDEAIAWQFRGFKSSGGLGGNTGLIWRRAVANDRALAGANVFLDYETYADENFWRGSAGAELRSAWADVFGNVYRGFSDDVKKNNRTTYTADGYDVELNVHSPELPWLVGEVAYYNFEGKAGDKDDDGVRFGLRFNPLTDLELGVEYDNGDSDDDGKKKWAARIRYSGEFGGVLKAQYRPSTNSGNFEPRDWFFAPVEREYSQRIRKSPDTGSTAPTFTFSADSARLVAILPIRLQGQGGSLDLTIPALTTPSDPVILMGTVNGVTITPRTLTAVVDAATNITTYRVMVAQARTGIITVTHKGGSMTYAFPRTDTTVTVESDVAISTRDFDFFRLIDGSADIMVGTSGGGTVFIVENVESTANNLTLITRLSVPIGAAPVPVTLKTNPAPGTPKIQAPTNIGVLVQEVTVASDGVRTTMSQGTLSNPQGRVVLAQSNFLIPGTPPVYYRAKSASGAVIVATLEATGGVGGYQWSKNSGALTISPVGVVRIPSDETATDNGKELVLDAKLIDGREANNPATEDSSLKGLADRTNDFMLTLTLEYRNIADLAASFNPSPAANVYGLTGEGQEIVVATVVAAGGPGDFTYAKTSGQLDVRSAGGNGGFGHVYIPSGVVPVEGGSPVTLRAELSQPLPDDAETRTVAFSLTVQYIGVSRISPPAFVAATDKAILEQSATSYQVTALSTDDSVMNIATLAEVSEGGVGGFTYTKITGELGFSGRVVSIPSGVSPNGQRLSVAVRISDLGTGSTATPDVTVMLTVQYVSVNTVNLSFDDRDANPTDGLVTVYGLEGQMTAYANVARVVAGGGFGEVTLAKTNGQLELSGTTAGAQINIPENNPPQPSPGATLSVVVVANDGNDDENITAPATATITVRYVEVKSLNATFSRVNARNGQVGSALGEKVLTVGMTTTNPSAFTVAKLMTEGGVGSEYTYTRVRGNGELQVNAAGEVLIRENTPPGDLSLTVVVQVDDSGDNSQVSPAFLASLTVFYNTIGVIAAEVVDTRNNAVPSVIKADGGTVYFLSAGGNASTEFGRLEVNGGLGNQISDYTIDDSNASGLTYNDTTRILSMNKCTSGTKSIRFTINDDSVDSGDTTEDLVFNFSVTNECVGAIAAQLRNADNSADATSPLEIFGVEGKTEATVVAAWMGTGGGGDLTWTPSGDLRLVAGNDNKVRQVQIPAGTSPEASPGNPLSVTVVVNDENDKGGFLTEPLTVEAKVNYVEVASVRLALNDDDDNAITSPVNVYGVESVAKAADKRKVANIAASGGAGGALALSFQTSGDGATTADSFEIVGNNAVNITKAFPAFGASELATVAVVASDSGANSGATPDVTVRATVRLLPVLAAVEEGGHIVENGSADNVVAPTSPSATEANFTVYVLANAPHTIPIAQVSAAAVTRNAGVAGASGLRVQAPTRHSDSTPEASGLTLSGGNPVAQIRISPGATATSGGADLKLVLEYEDEGFDAVADLTAPRRKTVNVHYELVTPFTVQFRTPDDVTLIPDNDAVVTSYVAAGATEEVRVARLNQIGGADGMDIVSQSGDLMAKKIGDVFYAVVTANTDIGNTLHLTVMMDDAPGAADNSPERAQGSQTPPVRLELTVAYLETQDVVAQLADIAGNDHFLGAADSTSGVRTLYFKDGATRPAQLDILRINAQSGSGDYTFEDGTPDGFALKAGTSQNNMVLALLQAKADGATALATVVIDDTGAGSEISEPATLTVSVAVKDVRAIETALIVPANVPGVGPGAGTTLGGLYVRSAAAAESSSVYIASVVARGGVEQFTYTRQSESSAELLLNDDGQVHLAENYTPDGNKTLSILIAVNDTGDGSTLTEAAMMTLQFVLAETIEATVFLRGGVYLPGGSGNEVVVSDSAVATVRVKTADYGNEHTLFGVKASGGLGKTPAYSIARATGGNENGLVARVINPDGYPAAVLVKQGASGSPKTFGITAVINESTTDPNDLTPPATISVTVLYTAVDQIAGAFQEEDGTAIVGRHVVAKQGGAETNNYQVAKITPSGGVGGDGNGFGYTFTQDTPGDLIVDGDGKVLVKGGVVPAIGLNLSATVKINDTGNWSHVSDELVMEITVLYSSEVPVNAAITDIRTSGTITPNSTPPQTVYFNAAVPHANVVFATVKYTSGLPTANTFNVVASAENGLDYDATNERLRIVAKCGDDNSADKSIRLVVNDDPDPAGVSKPLTVDITVHSGEAECIDPLTARPETIVGTGRGAHITDTPKVYRLAGDDLDANLPVATVHVDGGAPAYVSGRQGGGLNLDGNNAELMTVVIPSGTAPSASPNPLEIVITVNDDSNKGGFLTDEVEVKMTVDFAEVQPHGEITADKVGVVLGDVASRVLTVRRVAADTSDFDILTNMGGANAAEERILAVGNANGIRLQADLVNSGRSKLVMIQNQIPNGEVRIITVRVEDYKPTGRTPDDDLQFAARPDKLFTISVRYEGMLQGAAYDSENTANAISAPVNRYVEQRDSNVAVAVASLSVSGGASPYTYNLTGELALADNNASLVIPASATPEANDGKALTARIVIDDTGRTDTAPLTVELTANYILIPGHSDLQLVRDGRTQAEDLSGDTVYPKIVGAKSSGVVEALSGLAFKAGLSGETLKRESSGSAAELLFADDASVVQIAGDTEPDGSTLALVLRASDGESPAQAKARSDRLYTLQVRYMKELTADARTAASGGDVINAVRQIRVTEAEATDTHFVAHISVDGGAGGNVIAVGGTDFEIEGNELRIAADVVPGDLASGKLLTATVKVNDNGDAVGGADTGEVEILVTANYITLPPVVGSFVETRGDGTKNVPTSSPVTVFSFYTFPPQNLAPATVVATAKATVTGRDGDTFTYHRVGGADTFSVDENTGAIEIKSRRPTNGDVDQHLVTVEFRAAANAVATRQTLTVRHQMIRSIASGVNALSTPLSCYQNVPQPNPPNRGNQGGTQITVILPPGEEGTQYSPGGCSYFVNLPNRFVGIDPAPPGGNRIARTGQDASGLEVYSAGSDTRVRLVGTPPTFTAEDITLSVVVANTHTGPGGHVVPAFLQTAYVVFPGVEKLNAVLEDSSGADAAITKPLTVYVGDTDASAKVVASVKASGGEGTEYSYTGTRTGGDNTALLLITTADSNEIANRIAVPAGFVAKVSPGTEFRFEVAVNDTGGNAARRGATPERKVILTLQYIKTSGPLQAEAAYTTPDIADAANTTYYGAKGEALGAAVNVANIAPSGGIPNYSFAIEEDSSNPAANSELEISGSGNTRVVRLKSGATPSAATSEARRRVITVRVTDTGDVGNSIPVETVDVVVSVNFVEVETHGDLTVEDAGGNNLGTDFVVVTSGVSAQDVVLAPAASVYPERPTRRQDLGREAGVVSEVSHHGLRFNSNGLVITANTPLEGQTLSVVVQATDGATSQPTAAAQAAARQDQTYTISVRYVPAIAAEVLSTTNAALSNTDVVELTVVAGTQLVGKVSASGGVGGTYSYTPTSAQAGGTNLAVDADGNINIIAGTIPVAGDGLSITVNIAVDDDSASADADRDETSAANVQIRVKYVLLEDLALTAKDAGGNNVGAEASLGTFYLRDGASTDSQVLVGSVEASGGIQGYTYARKGTGGDLTFDPQTRQLHIPNNTSAADPNTEAATLLITLEVTDSQDAPVTKDLTVRAVFVKVSPHGDLTIAPESGITPNSRNEYVVVRPASHTNAVDVANITAPQGDTVSKTGGDSELEFTAPNLRIANNTSPTGQTVTAQITQTDGGDADDLTDEKGARIDRIHQIAVRYIPALAAVAQNAAGDAALNAPIVITSKAGLRQVARIAASGGTSDSYSYTIENLHTGGNELMVGGSDGIVSIPAGVQPIVGGLALTVRITANDSGDDNDKTDPASAEVTVMYHLLESPEIEAQNLAGTKLDNTNTPTFYRLSGSALDNDLPVAKVVGSKGSGTYTYAIVGADGNGVANGMRVDTAGNEGNIVIVSGQSAAAAGSADRIVTVRLTDNQGTPESADATLTIRFEAVAPHDNVQINVQSGVTRAGSEFIVVQAGAPAANVHVMDLVTDDTLSKTGGDAALAFVAASPHDRLEILSNTPRNGQTLIANIRQTDGDDNDLERTRPDQNYVIAVRYIPALAAEVRNAAGDTPLAGVLEIEAETPASLNIASIAVSGGTSDTYTYAIRQLHSGGNALGVTDDGVVYIPVDVAPLPTEGLSLTAEITANDKADSKNANATPAALATITVKYVMDPGVQAEAQDLAGTAINPASPPAFYRLLNDPIPDTPITGMPVAKVVASGGTPPYRYVVFGNTNPDGLGVDQTSGEVAIQTGQTGDDPAENKVRKVTVRITDNRQPNARETLATISVIFEAVGRFGNLLSDTPENDAYKNPAGHYVLVRPGAVSQALVVIDSFGIGRADTVTKFGGSNQLVLDPNAGAFRLRIAPNTVPGGVGGAPGGLTLIADLQANDDDSTPQKRARPNKSGYLVTVIYLAEIDATVEDASDTEIPDLANIDITGPANEGSVYVGDIEASGGTGDYSYTKLASGGGELSVDDNGQVFIPASAEPTADDGTQLFIVVDVDDKGANNDRTAAKRISLDVDYILDPGLSGQVQNLDGTPATSTPTIYRLAGDTVPDEGLATGLKVVGQRGTGYTYAIEGTSPNPDGLSVDASSGVISIVAGQTPDTDTSKVRVVTVKISGTRNGNPSEALVTVSVIFRAVEEISANNFQIQANERCGFDDLNDPTEQTLVLPAQEERTAYRLSGSGNCGFFTLVDETNGSGFGFRGGSGNIARTVLRTNGLQVNQNNLKAEIQLSSEPFEYTAERATLSIVLAYNDEGPAKDLTAEHRKTIYVVFPGIPSVDAVLNDAGGTAIPDLTDIDITVPEDNVSVYVGDIVASGGTGGTYTFEKDGTAGNLAVDTNGQVYILADAVPIAAPGTQLEMTVNVNDGGTNNDRTKAKQLTIEVDYILQLGLSGQTQQTDGTAVSGEHIVLRQADVATPSGGLDAGVKVVGQNGEGNYQYAAAGTAADSQLEVSTSGEVKIKENQTATGQLLLLTVQISDSASTPATALHTVSIRFNSVAPHADLTRDVAAGVTENSAGEFVVVQDGTPSSSVPVMTNIKSGGAVLTRVASEPLELLFGFNTFNDANVGNLRVAGNIPPTGQTLEIQLRASDGEATPEAAARQDRTFDPIAVRYLSHLTGAKLQDASDADIDLSSAVLVTAAGGASVYVGDIAASGGTGEYTFGKDATTGGLTVSPAGQVYLRSDAVPTSEGAAFAMTVNVNDSGKDNEVTNGTAIEITVNYILQATGPALPLYNGDLTVLRDKGAGGLGRNRICPFNTLCEEIVGIITPEIVTHDRRLTVFGFNTDTAPVFIFTAAFSVPAVITETSGSHFSVGAGGNSPFGIRYPVMLKTENLHKWGQELEARLRVRDPDNTLEQLVTVTVLLAERVPPASLTVGITSASNHGNTPGSRTNTNANRPMQWLNPNDVGPTDTPPGFQAVADFPGMTVTDVEVVRVRVSSLVGNPPDISTWGDFQWDEEAKIVRRNGIRPAGSDPFYDVWVRGKDPNPKMVPTPLSFRLRYRGVSPLAWQTTPPSTIAPSGVTSFEVKGGAQARNYSPLRDMVAEVNAPFVISNMRISRAGSNDWRFLFDVGLSSGASAGAHTANIVVRDRGYTSFGTLTHTATATK